MVLTQQNNHGVGPCVNRRSHIINLTHWLTFRNGYSRRRRGPPGARGSPLSNLLRTGRTNKVIGCRSDSAATFAGRLTGTSMPASDYYGYDGLISRDDLAGLNITTVPKVLIECGNMRNATDAGLLISAVFQQRKARGLEAAIIRFLADSRLIAGSALLGGLGKRSAERSSRGIMKIIRKIVTARYQPWN